MPETIVYNRERHGLPYSKGLMAQSLSASGLSPARAYELAQIVERRLEERTGDNIGVDQLNDLVEEVLLEQESTDAVRRFHEWQRLDRLDKPLVVMLAGSTGVGKSTLATMLAARLGITRVIATDVIRQVLRAFFSREFMPVVHYSAFEAGTAIDRLFIDPREDPDILGFSRQARSVATGVDAIVERACLERTPMVLEASTSCRGRCDPSSATAASRSRRSSACPTRSSTAAISPCAAGIARRSAIWTASHRSASFRTTSSHRRGNRG